MYSEIIFMTYGMICLKERPIDKVLYQTKETANLTSTEDLSLQSDIAMPLDQD